MNCSIFIDGAINLSNTSIINNTASNMSLTNIAQGNHTWYSVCLDTANNSITSSARNFTVDTNYPTINLMGPANSSTFSDTNITFNFNATDNLPGTFNCSLMLNGVIRSTNSSVINNTATNFSITGLADGTHSWNISCMDNVNNSRNSSTITFTIATPVSSARESSSDFVSLPSSSPLRSISYAIEGNNGDTTLQVQSVLRINTIPRAIISLIKIDPYIGLVSTTDADENGLASFTLSEAGTYEVNSYRSGYPVPDRLIIIVSNEGARSSVKESEVTKRLANETILVSVCGNNITEAGEVCDGADLFSQSCQSKGYVSGKLKCAYDCLSFDVSSCYTVKLSECKFTVTGLPYIGQVNLVKISDKNNNACANAEFTLSSPDGSRQILKTNYNGETSFVLMNKGEYVLYLPDENQDITNSVLVKAITAPLPVVEQKVIPVAKPLTKDQPKMDILLIALLVFFLSAILLYFLKLKKSVKK